MTRWSCLGPSALARRAILRLRSSASSAMKLQREPPQGRHYARRVSCAVVPPRGMTTQDRLQRIANWLTASRLRQRVAPPLWRHHVRSMQLRQHRSIMVTIAATRIIHEDGRDILNALATGPSPTPHGVSNSLG